ncbi:hypothetical protein OAO01_07310 [Oligoflexia bacterium]|nr:hypothetical protein [Oligoflexia bacterium]
MKKYLLITALLGLSVLTLTNALSAQTADDATGLPSAAAASGGASGVVPPPWIDYTVSEIQNYQELVEDQLRLIGGEGPCPGGYTRTSSNLSTDGAFPETFFQIQEMRYFVTSYQVEMPSDGICSHDDSTFAKQIYSSPSLNSICLRADALFIYPDDTISDKCQQAHTTFWACCDG